MNDSEVRKGVLDYYFGIANFASKLKGVGVYWNMGLYYRRINMVHPSALDTGQSGWKLHKILPFKFAFHLV